MSNITEIAKLAKTSTATVSHAIHNTRYVSSKLKAQVIQAMNELGYEKAIENKITIGLLMRRVRGSYSADLVDCLAIQFENVDVEIICIITPSQLTLKELKLYQKKYKLDFMILHYSVNLAKSKNHANVELPLILLNSDPTIYPLCYHVNFDYRNAVTSALRHLINQGHKDIVMLGVPNSEYINQITVKACKEIYQKYGLKFDESRLLLTKDSLTRDEHIKHLCECMKKFPDKTAIVTTETLGTMHLLDYLSNQELKFPDDVSVITIGDMYLAKVFFPNNTRVDMKVLQVVSSIDEIVRGKTDKKLQMIPIDFITGDSTRAQMYDRFGRLGSSATLLDLDDSSIKKLRQGNFSVCLSSHNEASLTVSGEIEGLRDNLNSLGIRLISQSTAYGNDELQALQIKGFADMKPNAVVCIPNHDSSTLENVGFYFKKKTKFILSSCIPEGYDKNDFNCLVSTNTVEAGRQAGRLLGNYMMSNDLDRVAFFSSNDSIAIQRDKAAQKIIDEEYPHLKTSFCQNYNDSSNLLWLVKESFEKNEVPQALYISQSKSTEAILDILSMLGYGDVKVVTYGLRGSVIERLRMGRNVVGIVAPPVYDIGRSLALSTARAILGIDLPPCVSLNPVSMTQNNLSKAWVSVMKYKLPEQL